MWQYAQLVVSYDSRLATDGGEWTIAWYGPDTTTESKSRSYRDVVVELNGAGKEGWELIDVAALGAEGSGHTSSGKHWPLTGYTFRRSSSPRVPPGQTEALSGRARPFAQTMGTDQGSHTQPDDDAVPKSAEPVTLVRFAFYCKPDDESARSDQQDSGSGLRTGRFFMMREVARLQEQPDIEAIESLGRLYEASDVSSGLRERIKGAAADYAATWAEGQWGAAEWWQTPQSFPLASAADLFDGSADWLRGLVEHPVDGALSVAGVEGPFVSVDAGITVRFVTGPVTERLEGAARICEIAGIVIGTLVGAHPLVMASAKRFLHDEGNKLLGQGSERVINSIGQSLRATADREIEAPESSRRTRRIVERKPGPSHGVRREPTRPGRRRSWDNDWLDRESETPGPPSSVPNPDFPGRAEKASREGWSGADYDQGTTAPRREPNRAPGRPGAGENRSTYSYIREPGPWGWRRGGLWRGRGDDDGPGRGDGRDRGSGR